MNCDDINTCLSEGQPLNGSAQEHVRTCSGCRSMIEAFGQPLDEPEPERVEQISQLIRRSLQPVRPLPSDGAMIGIAVSLFLGFAILVGVSEGYKGFRNLTSLQRLVYYFAITGSATLFGLATVQEMIPGSKKRLSGGTVTVLSLASIAAVAIALFRNFDLADFVKVGVPCLIEGSCCAAASGVLGYFFIRKGFAVSSIRLFTTAGFFCGLAGVGVLALCCPVQNSAHIIVWHLGAMVLAGFAGVMLGVWQEQSSTKNTAVSVELR